MKRILILALSLSACSAPTAQCEVTATSMCRVWIERRETLGCPSRLCPWTSTGAAEACVQALADAPTCDDTYRLTAICDPEECTP